MLLEKIDKASIQAALPIEKHSLEVGGIPINSEFVIFIVNTSASMNLFGKRIVKVMDKFLEIQPTLVGIQIINDNGTHLFFRITRILLPDTSITCKNEIERCEAGPIFPTAVLSKVSNPCEVCMLINLTNSQSTF